MSMSGSVEDLPKKFYKSADIEACEGGWRVVLDGRPVKTPSGAALVLASQGAAQVVAEEWAAQVDFINIPEMHLTRLVNVSLDQTPNARDAMADEVARYAETDLVCHLADHPAELKERQDAAWRPLRDWAGEALNVILIPTDGVLAVRQPPASIQAVRDYALGRDDLGLTMLTFATGLFGSAVLALAVSENRLSAVEALDLSVVDEAYQAEQWGQDDEAQARIAERREAAEALDQLIRSV